MAEAFAAGSWRDLNVFHRKLLVDSLFVVSPLVRSLSEDQRALFVRARKCFCAILTRRAQLKNIKQKTQIKAQQTDRVAESPTNAFFPVLFCCGPPTIAGSQFYVDHKNGASCHWLRTTIDKYFPRSPNDDEQAAEAFHSICSFSIRLKCEEIQNSASCHPQVSASEVQALNAFRRNFSGSDSRSKFKFNGNTSLEIKIQHGESRAFDVKLGKLQKVLNPGRLRFEIVPNLKRIRRLSKETMEAGPHDRSVLKNIELQAATFFTMMSTEHCSSFAFFDPLPYRLWFRI